MRARRKSEGPSRVVSFIYAQPSPPSFHDLATNRRRLNSRQSDATLENMCPYDETGMPIKRTVSLNAGAWVLTGNSLPSPFHPIPV